MSTINVTNLKGRGGASPTLPDGAVVTGVATATTFSGTLDGSLKTTGTPTLGLGVTINASGVAISGVCTAGIVSATTFYGSGSGLTGVGETIAPWHYNPDINDTSVTVGTGIGITFNKKVEAGSGTATLKIVNAGAAGTTIQSWGVSSCTFNVTEFTLGSLVSSLIINQTYQVDIPEGFIVDSNETSYVGTAYTFSVQDAEGTLWMWGYNDDGMLGVNNHTAYSSPIQIPGTDWTGDHFGGGGATIKNGANVKTDGTLWIWGEGNYGQLGVNSVVKYSSPVQVPGTTWSTVSIGGQGMTAIKTDGTLWSWGRNNTGQLGDNSVILKSSPVQIPGTTWSKSYHSNTFSYAIKTNGTLWAWGEGIHGALGQNDLADRSSPVQIPGTTWRSVDAGRYLSVMATKTNGTLWMWGENAKGQSGQNNRIYYSSPVQIPGTTWTVNHDVEDGAALAVKTDGTLWTWGDNEKGQLGQNNGEVKVSSPVQVPGTSWSTRRFAASSGSYGPLAIRTDGTLWTWGTNNNGQLGLNQAAPTTYSSPVQIGSGTNWWTVRKLYYASMGFQNDTTP